LAPTKKKNFGHRPLLIKISGSVLGANHYGAIDVNFGVKELRDFPRINLAGLLSFVIEKRHSFFGFRPSFLFVPLNYKRMFDSPPQNKATGVRQNACTLNLVCMQ
jgi:hypothetical protein